MNMDEMQNLADFMEHHCRFAAACRAPLLCTWEEDYKQGGCLLSKKGSCRTIKAGAVLKKMLGKQGGLLTEQLALFRASCDQIDPAADEAWRREYFCRKCVMGELDSSNVCVFAQGRTPEDCEGITAWAWYRMLRAEQEEA